jgi:membrane-associated phospholipid phosphatase
MNGVLEWGYDLISWTQQFSPALDTLFKTITTLGAEQGFLLLLPLVFWCLDKRRGARLGALLMLSAYLNYALKALFDQPRPSADRVKVMADETSPGLPSGHSQGALVFYGYLAAQARRGWAWVVAGLLIFSVGLSRIYLGAHFPSDVLGGWLVGAGVLAFYLRVEPDVEHYVRPWPWSRKMALAVVLPLSLFLVYRNEVSAQLMGTLLGLMAGVLIELRWVRFSVNGPLWQRLLRYVVGGTILVGLWLGLKVILPDQPETTALIFRLVRYALVGAWAALGAPWLFVSVGLAPRESEAWR